MSEPYAMPLGDFAKGWKLLILQPWGWRYRGLDNAGNPSAESLTQMNFYYTKLNWAQFGAWMSVAELFAQGKEWPSVTELTQSLKKINGRFIKALPAPNHSGVPMPEDVREKLSKFTGRSL